MSRNIPQVRRWLVNYWRDGKVVMSFKVAAPTKFLAVLAHNDNRPRHLQWCEGYDRRTITPMKSTRNAGKIVPL